MNRDETEWARFERVVSGRKCIGIETSASRRWRGCLLAGAGSSGARVLLAGVFNLMCGRLGIAGVRVVIVRVRTALAQIGAQRKNENKT